ncbi:DNA-3-methyladenine glycosylase [soil metagenome]
MTLTALYEKAAKHLAKDAKLKPVIDRVGLCTLTPRADEPFSMLVRCVIAQQISGKAADAISGKLAAKLKNRVTPKTVAALSDDDLRVCGISGPKQRAIRSILQHGTDNKHFYKSMPELGDEEFIEAVTAIKGIGPWSADMLLMFGYGRTDVLPVGDYGLKAGVRDLYGLDDLPKPPQLIAIAEAWRPYRSIATWYIWRSKGPVPNSN